MSDFYNKVRRNYTVYDIFLAATTLFFISVRLRLMNISFERDEGEYAYAAQEILRGGLPYKDFYNMKMPGVYYIMAILFKFFGDSVYTVKISLLCVNLFSAFFIFLTTRKLFDKNTGVAAAAIFLLFCLSYSAQGWTANAEHYVVMFGCAGLFFTIVARKKNRAVYLFPAGILMMLAFICKQHGIGFLLFPFIWMLDISDFRLRTSDFGIIRKASLKAKNSYKESEIRNPKSEIQNPKFKVQSLFYCITGACLPFAIMLFYFWKSQILPNFYFLTFSYADAYASQRLPFKNVDQFRPIFWDNFIFWFLALLLVIFFTKSKIRNQANGFFPILLLCSFGAISLGWYYRPHYFQLGFPVGAIMSAWILVRLKIFLKFKGVSPARYILIAFVATLIIQFDYFFTETSAELMPKMYGHSFFNEKKIIGLNLNNLTANKHAKIGLFGCEPQIFFYARRQSATGYMYMFPLLENHRFVSEMSQTFIKEIETAQPELLIYFPDIDQLSENETNLIYLKNWFANFSMNYNIVAQAYIKDGVSIIDWRTENKMRVCLDSTIALIYKRK